MHKFIEKEVDSIDAAVFTGDIFLDDDERAEFRRYLERWEKELKVWDERSKELAQLEQDEDNESE